MPNAESYCRLPAAGLLAFATACFRAAGMEAGVQEIPVEVLVPTQDSALEGMRATSVTQLILGALSETEQARLEAAMRAEMETFRERDGYRFRGLALLLQGRKPAPTS